MIEASIICDSVSPQGKRLTTFKLRYPKFIHGEMMTHRVISRNASSSRAVPTKKLLEEVRSDALRAAPVFWGKNQSGMQATEELSDEETLGPPDMPGIRYSPKWSAQNKWSMAAYAAASYAEQMEKMGVHKQIVNRLLEPFSHINVVATATEWDNFFGLRLHKDAQPEMRALAVAMWKVYDLSSEFARPVKLLKPGEWHLPFISEFDDENIQFEHHRQFAQQHCMRNDSLQDIYIKVSVARCARVSYESFDTGKRSSIDEDLRLYDRLLGSQPLHASPAEHQGTPDIWVTDDEAIVPMAKVQSPCPLIGWQHPEQHGNFVGWRQFRKMLPGEAVAPIPEEFR